MFRFAAKGRTRNKRGARREKMLSSLIEPQSSWRNDTCGFDLLSDRSFSDRCDSSQLLQWAWKADLFASPWRSTGERALGERWVTHFTRAVHRVVFQPMNSSSSCSSSYETMSCILSSVSVFSWYRRPTLAPIFWRPLRLSEGIWFSTFCDFC